MFIAQIQFPFDPVDEDDEAQAIVFSILAAMWQNGQLCARNFSVLNSPQGFSSFVAVPAENALVDKHYNKWVES